MRHPHPPCWGDSDLVSLTTYRKVGFVPKSLALTFSNWQIHFQDVRSGDNLPQLKEPSQTFATASPFLSATELTSKWPLSWKTEQKASQVCQSPAASHALLDLLQDPGVLGSTPRQAGCRWGTRHKVFVCLHKPVHFFSFSFPFSLAPNRIVFWFWKASAGMQRTERWLRRWWPSHLLCIVEYIFHMLLGEISNKGHQMLEIEQKEIKEKKRKKNICLISSRELCLDSGPWCCRKKSFCFEQLSFWLTFWKECAEQINLPPPLATALLKSERTESSLLTCERDLSIFIWTLYVSHDTNTFQMLRYKITT